MSAESRSPEALRLYYDQCLAAHGDTAQGAGWPNEADRRKRFAVMRALAPGGAMEDLCDLACGTGGFLEYLVAAGAAPRRYLGLDLSPAAVAAAQAKHGPERFVLHDILRDPLPAAAPFDYVVANGLFTVKAGLSHAEMWRFMEAAVARMWAMARRGIAFNVMSTVVDWQRADLFHASADALLEMLHAMAGRQVVLRADYGLYEYSAYVYRQPLGERRF